MAAVQAVVCFYFIRMCCNKEFIVLNPNPSHSVSDLQNICFICYNKILDKTDSEDEVMRGVCYLFRTVWGRN